MRHSAARVKERSEFANSGLNLGSVNPGLSYSSSSAGFGFVPSTNLASKMQDMCKAQVWDHQYKVKVHPESYSKGVVPDKIQMQKSE